jgi:hypothetical protein
MKINMKIQEADYNDVVYYFKPISTIEFLISAMI